MHEREKVYTVLYRSSHTGHMQVLPGHPWQILEADESHPTPRNHGNQEGNRLAK